VVSNNNNISLFCCLMFIAIIIGSRGCQAE
jgi:hypothetical protein